MDDSDLSSLDSLSPPPPSDHEDPPKSFGVDGSNDERPIPYQASSSSSEAREPSETLRSPSPPHEYVLADNPDIAFIVMFRSRFSDAFSSKLGHFGPQDIERGVMDPIPSPQVETLLCALLALVLNRKKPIERGHYGRALEEALLAQKSQWPRAWNGQNPLSGSRTFVTMSPSEKLTLLKTLIIWSLHSSEVVSNMVRESYKGNRSQFDLGVSLAVQPWGADGRKRVYWLIEGQDDTSFRIYTERRAEVHNGKWKHIAGSIEELQAIITELRTKDNAQAAQRLADRMERAIPRFEATEEKRKRREYRVARRAQFVRPEPGFSLYEGRTRGKRTRYTFEEDEDDYTSDALSTRRSARQSGAATPAEPTVTASGRQVRPRMGGRFGEIGVDGVDSADRDTPASADYERSEKSEEPGPPPDANVKYYKPKGRGWKGWAIAEDAGEGTGAIHGYNEVDAMEEDDEDEAMSSGESGMDWDGADDESDVIRAVDADDEDDDEDDDPDDDLNAEPKSLIVTLKYSKPSSSRGAAPASSSSIEAPAGVGDQAASQSALPTPQRSSASSVKLESPLQAATPAVASATSSTNATSTLTNGFAAPSPASQPKAEVSPAAPSPFTTRLPQHPSPTKTDSWQPNSDGLAGSVQPLAKPALTGSTPSPALTNGTTAYGEKRQQALDGLFSRTPAEVAHEAGKSTLPDASAPSTVSSS